LFRGSSDTTKREDERFSLKPICKNANKKNSASTPITQIPLLSNVFPSFLLISRIVAQLLHLNKHVEKEPLEKPIYSEKNPLSFGV
jgi:hypothetical protein